MCGILGYLDSKGRVDEARPRFDRALALMDDRGPDDRASRLVSPQILLGHTRLSIIDLSTGANQPFVMDPGLVLVFNGEIYNYLELRDELEREGAVFQTHSDTEALLAAYKHWGIDKALRKANGMFAFCIVDSGKRRAYLARDRFGQKPLLVHESTGSFAFASTIQALRSLTGLSEIDWSQIPGYLCFRFLPGSSTIFKGIRKVDPGELIELDLQSMAASSRRYWEPDLHSKSGIGLDLDEIEDLVRDSVRIHTRADVPLGVFLSGGIDSSLVSVHARTIHPDIRGLHVHFPNEPNDELEFAKEVANKLDLSLEVVPIEDQITLERVLALLEKVGEPFSDPALISSFLVSRAARESGFKAVLSGDGGDEIFCGYATARKARLLQWLRHLPAMYRRNDLAMIRAGKTLPVYLNLSDRRFADVMASCGPESLAGGDAFSLAAFEVPGDEDLLTRFARYDLRYRLAREFLTKVDSASMSCSLEVRCPLLNHEILSAVWRGNPARLASPFNAKLVLKKIMERHMGRAFAFRRKTGFESPVVKWLKGSDAGRYLSREAKVFSLGILDYDGTQAMLGDAEFVWRYFILGLWVDQNA